MLVYSARITTREAVRRLFRMHRCQLHVKSARAVSRRHCMNSCKEALDSGSHRMVDAASLIHDMSTATAWCFYLHLGPWVLAAPPALLSPAVNWLQLSSVGTTQSCLPARYLLASAVCPTCKHIQSGLCPQSTKRPMKSMLPQNMLTHGSR